MSVDAARFERQRAWAYQTLDMSAEAKSPPLAMDLLRLLAQRDYSLSSLDAEALALVELELPQYRLRADVKTCLRRGYVRHQERLIAEEIERYCGDFKSLSVVERINRRSRLARRAGPLPALAERLDELQAIPPLDRPQTPEWVTRGDAVLNQVLEAALLAPLERAARIRELLLHPPEDELFATGLAVDHIRRSEAAWAQVSPQTLDVLIGKLPPPPRRPNVPVETLDFAEEAEVEESAVITEFITPPLEPEPEPARRAAREDDGQFEGYDTVGEMLNDRLPGLAMLPLIACAGPFLAIWFLLVAIYRLAQFLIRVAEEVYWNWWNPHPKTLRINRDLLARADALYVDLPERLRDTLGALIRDFESAMALRNTAEIEARRAEIEQFIDRFGRPGDIDGSGS